MVVDRHRLPYDVDPGSPMASMLETDILANSVISDAGKGARFLSCGLNNFFLATPMIHPEYMKITGKYYPPDIITRYKLQRIRSSDGYVYCKIQKGMYGLKEAAVLAYNQLSTRLQTAVFQQVTGSIGIWTRPF